MVQVARIGGGEVIRAKAERIFLGEEFFPYQPTFGPKLGNIELKIDPFEISGVKCWNSGLLGSLIHNQAGIEGTMVW